MSSLELLSLDPTASSNPLASHMCEERTEGKKTQIERKIKNEREKNRYSYILLVQFPTSNENVLYYHVYRFSQVCEGDHFVWIKYRPRCNVSLNK